MAVVRALHLDDLVASGRRAGDADRVHRRLGAGVHEAHLVELEALADGLGQRDRVGSGDREVDRVLRSLGQRLHDLGVGVADDVDPEAAMEVLVLLAVDVPDARGLPLLEVDRVGVAHLEVRGDTPGQALHSPSMQLLGGLRVGVQGLGFLLGDLRRTRLESFKVHAYHLLRSAKSTREGPAQAICGYAAPDDPMLGVRRGELRAGAVLPGLRDPARSPVRGAPGAPRGLRAVR